MTKEDIEYIFRGQINYGADKLYYMLIDSDYKVIERTPACDIDSLENILSHFEYIGSDAGMPRFRK